MSSHFPLPKLTFLMTLQPPGARTSKETMKKPQPPPAPPARMTSIAAARVHPRDGQHGVGLSFEMGEDGALIVAAVESGGPAARSGVCVEGDELLKVDGTVVERDPIAEATMRIVGRAGTTLSLTLRRVRQGHPAMVYEVELVRGDAEFMDLSARNRALSKENSAMILQIQELQSLVSTLSEQETAMKRELQQREIQVSSMQIEVQNFSAFAARAQEERAAAGLAAARAEEELQNLRNTQKNIDDHVNRLVRELRSKERKLQEFTGRGRPRSRSPVDHAAEAAHGSSQAVKGDALFALDGCKGLNFQELQAELLAAKEELQLQLKVQGEAMTQYQHLEKQFQAKQEAEEEYKERLEQEQKANKSLKDCTKELNAEIQTQREDLQRMESEMKMLESRFEEERKSAADMRNSCESMQTELLEKIDVLNQQMEKSLLLVQQLQQDKALLQDQLMATISDTVLNDHQEHRVQQLQHELATICLCIVPNDVDPSTLISHEEPVQPLGDAASGCKLLTTELYQHALRILKDAQFPRKVENHESALSEPGPKIETSWKETAVTETTLQMGAFNSMQKQMIELQKRIEQAANAESNEETVSSIQPQHHDEDVPYCTSETNEMGYHGEAVKCKTPSEDNKENLDNRQILASGKTWKDTEKRPFSVAGSVRTEHKVVSCIRGLAKPCTLAAQVTLVSPPRASWSPPALSKACTSAEGLIFVEADACEEAGKDKVQCSSSNVARMKAVFEGAEHAVTGNQHKTPQKLILSLEGLQMMSPTTPMPSTLAESKSEVRSNSSSPRTEDEEALTSMHVDCHERKAAALIKATSFKPVLKRGSKRTQKVSRIGFCDDFSEVRLFTPDHVKYRDELFGAAELQVEFCRHKGGLFQDLLFKDLESERKGVVDSTDDGHKADSFSFAEVEEQTEEDCLVLHNTLFNAAQAAGSISSFC